VPLSQFAGDERTDILVVALISILVLLLVTLAVVVFVERFVKRPIARLEGGVARIADGDYATAIPVRSEDELGRLAANVNRMRDSIAGYVREIEDARAQLDNALEQVSGVSRALTTTTAGVTTLQQAVVRTAAAIGQGPRSSMLAMREGDALAVVAADGDVPPLADWPGLVSVLSGPTVRLGHADRGSRVAVPPMFYGRWWACSPRSPGPRGAAPRALTSTFLAVFAPGHHRHGECAPLDARRCAVCSSWTRSRATSCPLCNTSCAPR
jgi:HAMP domain-containing protein